MLARPKLAFGMNPDPGAFLLDADNSSTAGPSSVCSAFQMLVAFASLAQAFGIAGVIGQNFLGPITGGQLQQKTCAPSRAR